MPRGEVALEPFGRLGKDGAAALDGRPRTSEFAAGGCRGTGIRTNAKAPFNASLRRLQRPRRVGSAAMADDLDLTAHAARNRAVWNADAPNWVASGRKAWASPTPWWGMWELPEEELRILPDVTAST